VINLCIGFLTPPLGMNLFVAQGMSKQSLKNIAKQNMPFLLVLIVVMFITMLFPDIILFLPNYLK
jgi:C4-dicarboxylate transporter, DctM subunit